MSNKETTRKPQAGRIVLAGVVIIGLIFLVMSFF